jgi:hypothetical protein
VARENLSPFRRGLLRFSEAALGQPNPVLQRQREQQQLQQLGQILSGQTTPAFLRPGGAEGLTPEQSQQLQMRELAALGTPAATELLTQISPLTQRRRADVTAPSAVREFQFVQQLTPEQQRQFVNLKRADPLRAKGLVETTTGVQVQPGFARGIQEVERAREAGAQIAKGEFEPQRVAETAAAKKKAELQVARAAAFPQLEGAFQSASAKSDVVTDTIDEVLPKVGAATAGFGSLLAAIPGTPAADLAANIDTILANVGFEELQAMRDNSPTGGALGQVAVRELELLQATRANISNSQSPAQLRRNLLKLKEQVKGSRRRLENAFNKQARQAGLEPVTAPVQEVVETGESIIAPAQEGPTVTNPQTGEKLILREGQWVPL